MTVDQVVSPVMTPSQAERFRCPKRPGVLSDADKTDARQLADDEGVALLRLSDLYDGCADRAASAIVDLTTVPGVPVATSTPATR